jgi:DNA-binding transcriptional LysR family regulator
VVIGTTHHFLYELTGLVSMLRELNSELRMQLEAADPTRPMDIIRQIAGGGVDIGFVAAQPQRWTADEDERVQNLSYTLWRSRAAVTVVAPECYDQFMGEIELQHRVRLIASAGSVFAPEIVGTWQGQGVETRLREVGKLHTTAANYEVVKQSALAGLGVALLPQPVVEYELRNGRLRRFPSPVDSIPPFDVYMLARPGRRTAAVELVYRFFESRKDDDLAAEGTGIRA